MKYRRFTKEWMEAFQDDARILVKYTPSESIDYHLSILASDYQLPAMYVDNVKAIAIKQLQAIEDKKKFPLTSDWEKNQRRKEKEREAAKDLFITKMNELIEETGVEVQCSANYCGEGVFTINGWDLTEDDKEGLNITF
tara:strand:+ start:262 stop:678 length:417 start_codon:yes stop_codon:yes gene_type:complete